MNQIPKIKVCGMRDRNNINELVELKPDYIGFIFYAPSPRYIGDEYSPETLSSIPVNIKKVGVFVNASFQEIKENTLKYNLDAIQLHGNESVELCTLTKQLGVEVIKAFQVNEKFDFSLLNKYSEATDYYLFDTKTKNYGGSGQKFDWSVLNQYDNHKPFFLSGGITQNDVNEFSKLSHLNIYAIDINSKFEREPAYKDIAMVKQFIETIKTQNNEF